MKQGKNNKLCKNINKRFTTLFKYYANLLINVLQRNICRY